jgi:hypothetical protein
MSDLELVRRFSAELDAVSGRRCWAVYYGESTGAVIQVHFERKIARVEPLLNPNLSDEERRFDGEYALYISCAWRLDDDQNVLYSSGDALSHPEGLAAALEPLVGQQLVGVEASPPGWDATLTFDSGLRLRVFCDQPNDQDNYDLFTATVVYAVMGRKGVVSEPR